MSTPTPRTDARIWPYMTFDENELVPADFARTLERELNESRNAERLARVQLATEREKVRVLRSAFLFIAEYGGEVHYSELGDINCTGAWCAEQARAALAATKDKA